MRLSVLAIAAGLLLLSPVAARADLTGQTFSVTYEDTNQSPVFVENDGTFLVPGATFGDAGQFTLTLSGSELLIEANNSETFDGPGFNGFVLTDITNDPMISGVTTTLGDFSGLTPSFTSDSVSLNLEGSSVNAGDFAVLDMTFAQTPEPSSVALLGTGLLGSVGVMRRRFSRG